MGSDCRSCEQQPTKGEWHVRARQVFGSGLLALMLAACSPSGIRYSGVVVDPVRTPCEITEQEYAYDNESLLGHVQASCNGEVSLSEPTEFSSVVCSPDALNRSLRQHAAAVGGTSLAQASCAKDGPEAWTCGGLVMRLDNVKASSGAKAGKAIQASVFDIQVQEAGQQRQLRVPAKRGAEQVNVVPRVPTSDERLGLVVASCSEECGEREVREAVITTAAYLGADHVVYPSCEAISGGYRCQGVASAYQVRIGAH